jgi:hypothetical protein
LNGDDAIYSKNLIETYNKDQERVQLNEQKTYKLGYGQYDFDNFTQKLKDNPFKKLANQNNQKSSPPQQSSSSTIDNNFNNLKLEEKIVDADDEDKIKKFFETT